MASNKHGNENELEMVNYLDGKKVKELNLNMKEFIKYICSVKGITYHDNLQVIANYIKDNKKKTDLEVILDRVKSEISLKIGTGNSVHQEKIEDFVNFIKNHCNADEEIVDLWRFFCWGDGTINGTGKIIFNSEGVIESRFDASDFKRLFPEKRKKLQDFLDKNIEILVDRAVFKGKYDSNVEFVYHGNFKTGKWLHKQQFIDFHKLEATPSKQACLHVGNMTVQAWNVSKNGKNEKKRGEIQLKYARMTKDFNRLMISNSNHVGTFFGDAEEFDLSRKLNSNKSSLMWKKLLKDVQDYEDYYLVKVSSNQFSTLSQRKVKTKADAYVIKARIDKQILLKNQYILDEKDIQSIEHVCIPDTGVSIKMQESKKFTYMKFTMNSFHTAFKNCFDSKFIFTLLLLYSAEKEMYKNEKIIKDTFGSVEDFCLKIKTDISECEVLSDSSSINKLRKYAQSAVKKAIKNDDILAKQIFTGRYWFASPYIADYIYSNGELKENVVLDFIVTTGAGRSKGKYTIEIKPID